MGELHSARQTVTEVLTGAVTRELRPALFEDDVLYRQVAILSQGDPQWLVAQVGDRSLPFAGRLEVVRTLGGPLRDEALALLLTERPDDPALAFLAELSS